MSGGIAWVYDSDNSFVENCNTEMVDLDPLSPKDEEEILSLLKRHVQLTQSQVAKYIIDDWAQQSSSFIKVFPKEYKKVLLQNELQQSAG
jgi:glutamate synthase (NADPH/NADH) large chain